MPVLNRNLHNLIELIEDNEVIVNDMRTGRKVVKLNNHLPRASRSPSGPGSTILKSLSSHLTRYSFVSIRASDFKKFFRAIVGEIDEISFEDPTPHFAILA